MDSSGSLSYCNKIQTRVRGRVHERTQKAENDGDRPKTSPAVSLPQFRLFTSSQVGGLFVGHQPQALYSVISTTNNRMSQQTQIEVATWLTLFFNFLQFLQIPIILFYSSKTTADATPGRATPSTLSSAINQALESIFNIQPQ